MGASPAGTPLPGEPLAKTRDEKFARRPSLVPAPTAIANGDRAHTFNVSGPGPSLPAAYTTAMLLSCIVRIATLVGSSGLKFELPPQLALTIRMLYRNW